MKVYELKLQKGGKGVFKVSLVKDPAIESTLLKFSNEKPLILTFANEEKRIIYSVAMRPNLEIFRKDVNGEPAKVFYTAETVEEAQINYFRNNGNKNTNINHADENTSGVFPFESWIVRDAKTDRATLMGMEVINGDWVLGHKVDNPEIWADVKAGKLDGLSIEATNLEHIFKNNIEMNKNEKTFAQKLIEMAKDFLNTDIEIMSGEKKYTAENLEVGSIVKDSDGKPAKNLVFQIDEKEMKTGEDGEILEDEVMETEEEKAARIAKEAAANAEPTEKEKELMAEISLLKTKIADLEAEKVKDDTELEVMKADVVETKQSLATLQTEKATIDATVITMTAEIVELKKKTPGAPGIPKGPKKEKHTQEKPYAEMNNAEKTRHNREN